MKNSNDVVSSSSPAAHTPGPWHYTVGADAGTFCIWQRGDMNRIAMVQMGANKTDAYPYTETEANARLIASAPELLAALKALLDAVKSNGVMEQRQYVSLGIQVNNTIAKAEAL